MDQQHWISIRQNFFWDWPVHGIFLVVHDFRLLPVLSLLNCQNALVEFVLAYLVVGVAVGGGVGYFIGQSKGNATAGFWLGAVLGFIGWIIVAVMEPSAEERRRRAGEAVALASVARGTWSPGEPLPAAERACPFCAELIKPAAVVCRFCGRDVPAWSPPAPASLPADYDSLLAAYPTACDAVWEAAKFQRSWPAHSDLALRDACRRVLQGQSADKAVAKAFAAAHHTEQPDPFY
jgi:hypothetical protein